MGSILLRALSLARAEEFRRSQEQGLKRTRAGERAAIHFSQVTWKPGATLSVGADSRMDGACIFERDGAQITFGDRTYFGGLISCAGQVTIGDDVMISQGGYIADHDSHALNFTDRKDDVVQWNRGEKDWSAVPIAPITICDRVWIGYDVIILKGLTIGEGAVVAAGSVVTRDVEPYMLVAGNPAKPIRSLARPEP